MTAYRTRSLSTIVGRKEVAQPPGRSSQTRAPDGAEMPRAERPPARRLTLCRHDQVRQLGSRRLRVEASAPPKRSGAYQIGGRRGQIFRRWDPTNARGYGGPASRGGRQAGAFCSREWLPRRGYQAATVTHIGDLDRNDHRSGAAWLGT